MMCGAHAGLLLRHSSDDGALAFLAVLVEAGEAVTVVHEDKARQTQRIRRKKADGRALRASEVVVLDEVRLVGTASL